jgi:hypothetical protein
MPTQSAHDGMPGGGICVKHSRAVPHIKGSACHSTNPRRAESFASGAADLTDRWHQHA